ncbi:MAG: alpha/beta hydrolase [Pseudomonadales bacterium]|nr:alpha/beta hydrolase [Pseudomonadales bacterium]
MPSLPRIEFDYPRNSHPDAAIIWLHGLGADGSDFAGIVPELHLPETLAIRFLFPHAPSIPVSINNGFVMPAWYDILDADVGRRVDVEQLQQSAAKIHQLIDQLRQDGISSNRILLAGFSQGGAVVLQAALTYPEPLGGVLSLSSYFASADTIKPHPANVAIPIRLCHGRQDPVVAEKLGLECKARLEAMGYLTEYSSYPMEHSVCLDEIRDISAWISARLTPAEH